MKMLKFPKGAIVDNAMCIIPVSVQEKVKILLACIQIDLPFLYQPYLEDNPIVGESIIGSKEKTVNKFGTFFLNESQFKILEDILDFEEESYNIFLEDNHEIIDLLGGKEQLYLDYLERNKKEG